MAGKKRRRRSGQRNLLYEEPSWWGLVALGVIAFALVVALTVLLFRNSDPIASSAGERLSRSPLWPVRDAIRPVDATPQAHA